MKKVVSINIFVIIVAVVVASLLLKDTIIFYTLKSDKEREVILNENPGFNNSIINLGLDLKGGVRLVLDIDTTNLNEREKKDLLEKAYVIIENRVNRLGVSEASIQKQGLNRLILEVPGITNPETVKDKVDIQGQLEFRLLEDPAALERAVNIVDEVMKDNSYIDLMIDNSSLDSMKS